MASFYLDLYQTALALLINACKTAALSRLELAERFNQPEGFVASYESGDRLLAPAGFIAIARAIDVDPYELLGQAELRTS